MQVTRRQPHKNLARNELLYKIFSEFIQVTHNDNYIYLCIRLLSRVPTQIVFRIYKFKEQSCVLQDSWCILPIYLGKSIAFLCF